VSTPIQAHFGMPAACFCCSLAIGREAHGFLKRRPLWELDMPKVLYFADPSNGRSGLGATIQLDSGEPCLISIAQSPPCQCDVEHLSRAI
jgi:hypothetical protein